MTTKIDEWAADSCGVEIMIGMFVIHREGKQPEVNDYEWTIKDPRCREIVREHFKIVTARSHWEGVEPDYWISAWPVDDSFHEWTGPTIEEVEIAAITAIYEAEK